MRDISEGCGITSDPPCEACGSEGLHVCLPEVLKMMKEDKEFLKKLAALLKDLK